MPSSQPSRRNLVKGAAWSVPVVAVTAQASVAAASQCALKLSYTCTPVSQGQRIEISLEVISGPLPPSLEFTLSTGGIGTFVVQNGAATYQASAGKVTWNNPSAGRTLLITVTRTLGNCGTNAGTGTITLTGTSLGTCTSNTLSLSLIRCECPVAPAA